MLDALRGFFKRRGKEEAPPSPRALTLAPAVVLVCGAGVAFWWYTQWAHGRGEDEAGAAPLLPSKAQDALEESLGVQAAGEAAPEDRKGA